MGALRRLDTPKREPQRFQEQLDEMERQNANLATLYAAGHALHSSLKRDAVLQALQEIVINLVGSEEFAIVSADEQLTPLALFGISPTLLAGLTPSSGIIGRARLERRPLALPRGMPADATRVRVCIPLALGDKVDGFVLIFGFLPQKDDLSSLDHELFALVGSQAAAALYASEAFAQRGTWHVAG